MNLSVKRITVLIICLATVLLLGWDVFAVLQPGGVDNTISQVLIQSSHKYLIIPFSWGLLTGHLWA